MDRTRRNDRSARSIQGPPARRKQRPHAPRSSHDVVFAGPAQIRSLMTMDSEKDQRMFKIYRKELMWGGRKLTLETGRIARQADGAVLATYGDTMVLCTAVGAKSPKPGVDFFPLTVNYQEKTFAAGRSEERRVGKECKTRCAA